MIIQTIIVINMSTAVRISNATNVTPQQGTTYYLPVGTSDGIDPLNVTLDQIKTYCGTPTSASSLPVDTLVDGTTYSITPSADVTLPAIPVNNSQGIIIHIQPSVAITISTAQGAAPLQWYDSVPNLEIGANEHWVLSILDSICAISQVVTTPVQSNE